MKIIKKLLLFVVMFLVMISNFGTTTTIKAESNNTRSMEDYNPGGGGTTSDSSGTNSDNSDTNIESSETNSETIDGYSDVLDDLNRDNSFKPNDYPLVSNDYNMYIIHIAESNKDELFVYTYQPSHFTYDLIASSITFSNKVNDNGNQVYATYSLNLISSNGVFDKYLVEDFSVDTNLKERYYEITTLFRKFDKSIDVIPDGSDIVEVAMEVSQKWYVKEQNNSVIYTYDKVETVQVTAQFPGYVRYNDGYYLFSGSGYVDGHYYAFDTDKLIEDLIEVEMVYDVTYTHIEVNANHPFGKTDENTTSKRNILRYDEYAETAGGLFAPKRSWKRIMLVDDFIKYVEKDNGLNLTNKVKNNLKTCKWVVNFDEFRYYSWTDETSSSLVVPSETTKYSVSNIQPLRFKFITKGIPYNLGVIGDIVSPDNQPSNSNTTSIESIIEYFKQTLSITSEWFEKILMLIGVLILIVILGYFTPVLKVVFNFIIKVITAPFKLIGKLFKTKKRKR